MGELLGRETYFLLWLRSSSSGFRALMWAWQKVFLQIDRNLQDKKILYIKKYRKMVQKCGRASFGRF